ncbi:DMT family transporter [Pelagibacterium luteolum]|uniref:EamA domain-containing membrane protein RarD n=1 Tax=Pelagibacterium luteolum TaxID=440168 RepID=A0A1G7VWH5_9HYPH|nr:EamA family transporter [Pelagibacterium luteolum]SDG64145.1 EamA domain-containing membrane protein RarD [Pelagibacterium luteolum]
MTVRATLIGFLAILMWALLALFSSLSGSVPPFLLCAFSFSIATVIGLVATRRASATTPAKVPAMAWVIGVGGLFGYHFFYFSAVRNAPVVEANLINYLWPLLIVFGSALMPGGGLKWHHIAGALLGLAGTVLIVSQGGRFAFDPQFAFGYGIAVLAAITWAAYSLLSRRYAAVPTRMVTWYCAAAAVLSLVCHLTLEETVMPSGTVEWLAVIGMGLMPVGGAFFVWDYGVKHGNIQVLGAASYAAPLLSTLLLIVFGISTLTVPIALACILITGGAVLASKDMIGRRKPPIAAPVPDPLDSQRMNG